MPTTTTPTSPETPSARRRPCGMLELRRDAGGLRHYLLGHPVRAGAELEVQLLPGDGDWLDIEVRRSDRTQTGRLPLVRCSGGWAIGAPLD